jgi:hypothetical protein
VCDDGYVADHDLADHDLAERSLTAALAEFQAARGEIVQRIQLQQLIVGLTITAIGALLTVALAGKTSRASLLLATPFVTSALGVAHTDQAHRINVLGAYVRCPLWPYVARLTIAKLPSWEDHFSMLKHSRLQDALSTGYILMLFVISPLVADLYAAVTLHGRLTTGEWFLLGAGLATTVLYSALRLAVTFYKGNESTLPVSSE